MMFKKCMTFAAILLLGPLAVHAAPLLKVDDPVWSLGILVDGKAYEKDITLENAGDQTLVIEGIKECCGFYGKIEGRSRLEPGEKTLIHLTVKTFKMVGDLRAEMLLLSNDPQNPKYSVFAIGQVVSTRHVLGELAENGTDLGVVDIRERVRFIIPIVNRGNEPLSVIRVEGTPAVVETGSRPQIPAGQTKELTFDYVPLRQGPIDENVIVSTNDSLHRSLAYRLQGYVATEKVPTRALVIYPVGKKVEFDSQRRAFKYVLSIDNRSEQEVQILGVESSLPVVDARIDDRVKPHEVLSGEIAFDLKPEKLPIKGYLYLTIAIPLEAR